MKNDVDSYLGLPLNYIKISSLINKILFRTRFNIYVLYFLKNYYW